MNAWTKLCFISLAVWLASSHDFLFSRFAVAEENEPESDAKVEAPAIPVPSPAPKGTATQHLTLRDAVNKALLYSEGMKGAEERMKAAQSSETKAWAQFFPKVSAEAKVGTFHDRIANPGETQIPPVPRDRNSYEGQLVVRQSLFAGFRDVSALGKSRDDLTIAKMELQAKRDETVKNVIQTYYAIQLALRSLAAEEETATLRKNQLKETEQRFRAGRATEFDRLTAEYSVKAQGPRIESLKTELEVKTIRLGRYLGIQFTDAFDLTDDLQNSDAVLAEGSLPPLAEAFKTALERNPQILKLEGEFSKMKNENREQAARHLPSADVELRGGTNSFLRDQIVSNDSLTYSAQLIVSVPLFSGLDSFSERREKDARLRALTHDRAEAREKILEDLTQAYRNFTLAKVTIEAEKTNAALAQETMKRGKIFYQVGRATLTEVLDSVTRYLDARKKLAQALYDRLNALAEIKTYLGMGYSS